MKFADDSSFKRSAKTRDELHKYENLELVKVSNWLRNNRLTMTYESVENGIRKKCRNQKNVSTQKCRIEKKTVKQK
jgi:hypothetical protein